MKATTDLFELDMVFSQRPPLTPAQFIDEYKRRETSESPALLFWEQLEALHKAHALIPIYRLLKKVQPILRESHRRGISQSSVIHQQLGVQSILSNYLHGYDVGRLVDPRTELYKPWITNIRELAGKRFWTSLFCYSHYQLLLIPILRPLLRKMRAYKTSRKYSSFNHRFNVKPDEDTRLEIEKAVTKNYELTLCLIAIEAKYLPRITRSITNHRGRNLDSWFEYDQSFNPQKMLGWLGWNANQVRTTAENLLFAADRIDPLSEWYQLVRLCRFDKWNKLRGDALIAMDYRIAAEMLLLFYEDLLNAGIAPPLEPLPKKYAGPRRKRLGTDRKELSEVLMDFNISPQPSLVLVLEGHTEMLLVPRVFDLLGITLQSDLIRLFNAEGVDRKLGALAQYAITPEIGEALASGFLLTRPPSHFLVVVDPENRFTTQERREEERKKWVDDIWKAIPKNARLKISISEIDSLVEVETWNGKGESFEFAHFTDGQIAKTILRVYQGPDAPTVEKLTTDVRKQRTHSGNVENLWRRWRGVRPTKLKLADALWTILERRIQNALSHNTHHKIPVVKIVLQAVERAEHMHRYDVMIKTT